MSLSKVKKYFEKYNISDKIIELDVSSATVELASLALSISQSRIAKTLSFILNDKPILIVMAGDAKIDNSKYKNYFNSKAHMIPKEDVEVLIGHDVGGVCPFGINDDVLVYLDISLKRFKTVFPACGSSNSAIELTIDELEKYSNFTAWVDVSKII